MASSYPGALDTFTTKVDGVTEIMAAHVNSLQDSVITTQTYALTLVGQNLLPDTLTHEASWLAGTTLNDVVDDQYGPSLWNVLNDAGAGAAPDLTGTAGGSTDPFTRCLTCTLDATAQVGFVQFLTAQQTRPLRGQKVSLSLDLWATGITNIRFGVLSWTGTADAVTSDVVGTWDTLPTLATNWTYAKSSPGQSIQTTRTRHYLLDITIPTTANNLAVFVWLPAQEGSGDLFNVARVKLEPGTVATPFVARDPGVEQALISRLLQLIDASNNALDSNPGTRTAATTLTFPVKLDYPMRAAPALIHNITGYTAGAPGTTTVAAVNYTAGGFYVITGALTVTLLASNKSMWTLRFTAGTGFDGTTGNLATFRLGPSVVMLLDSRL